MTFQEYKYLILSDLYRCSGSVKLTVLLKHLFRGDSYKYVFWMRTCQYACSNRALRYCVYPFAQLLLGRYRYRLGISIPPETCIGSGFYIGHFGGIVVNRRSVIGRNCNISQGVTLGQSNRGAKTGCPVVGNNVYIGPGAKIVGAIMIGNDVAIGANCVVTRDVPDHSVVVGVPGKVVSQRGSAGYCNRTDYDERFGQF
jgi:serine O-acetyltransferase